MMPRRRSRCLRPCSGCCRPFSLRLRVFAPLPRQSPIYSRLLPPSLGDPCPPPSFQTLTEGQNRPRCNKLRDRILSPEDRCPHPHDPRVLDCSRQGEVLPLPVPPSAWSSPCQSPSDPALEGVQGRFHFPRQNPGLRPEESTGY